MISTKQGMFTHFKNTTRISRRLVLNFDNYKKVCYDSNTYRGVTNLEINIVDEKHESDLGRMVYEVTNSSKFDGVNTLYINAGNVPLDGVVLDTIARKKNYIRTLMLNVFTIYNPPSDMWKNFNGLEDLYINLSDGCIVPDAVSKLIEHSKIQETLFIENTSPFYPSFDMDILDKMSVIPTNIYISGYYIDGFNTRSNVHLSKCKYKNNVPH